MTERDVKSVKGKRIRVVYSSNDLTRVFEGTADYTEDVDYYHLNREEMASRVRLNLLINIGDETRIIRWNELEKVVSFEIVQEGKTTIHLF